MLIYYFISLIFLKLATCPFKDPAIELRSVTSRYHGSKISGAQATATATATRTSKKKQKNKRNNNFACASHLFVHFLAAVAGHEI